jgi:sugar phosphate isomerase/epimerase
MDNNFPKLHNAMWPGLVGKGSPGSELSIDLDTMLDLTAKTEVGGVKFDGVDLFLYKPHTDIDIDDAGIEELAEKISGKGLVVGSVVAPVWFDASAMAQGEQRANWLAAVRKSCHIASKLRDLGIRPYGIVRIDSACSVADWAHDPLGNTKRIAATFSEAASIAEDYGERLAAEGEICWGGMHSWRNMLALLEETGRPQTVGFQADMAHTLLYALGYNAEEDAILPKDYDWQDRLQLDRALQQLAVKLRPWVFDFHVAQNDATVKGSGTHDKTGRHCLPKDPNGKLDITRHAGYWLCDDSDEPTRKVRHLCWDGCMFPNEVMLKQQTWNDILTAMIAVRQAHGWHEQ